MSRLACALAALALLARTAAADEPPLQPGDKDPDVALGLSLGTTVVGAGMMAGGFAAKNDTLSGGGFALALLGPSAGHLYAERPITWGLGARVLGLGVFALGVSQFKLDLNFCFDESGCPPDPPHDNTGAGILMIAGAVLVGGGVIADIATARDAARDHNRERHLSLEPTALRGPMGETAPGFALSGTF